MKFISIYKLAGVLLLLCTSNAFAVETPFSINLGANGHDLEFDISRDVFYVSVPSQNIN